MNKTQLIDVIADKADLSKAQAKAAPNLPRCNYRVSERR